MSPEHTFLQQLKKVAKKRRSPTLSLILRSSIKTGREYALPARSHSKCIHAFCPDLISGARGTMSREKAYATRRTELRALRLSLRDCNTLQLYGHIRAVTYTPILMQLLWLSC